MTITKDHGYFNEPFITEWLTENTGFLYRNGETLAETTSEFQHIAITEHPMFGRCLFLDSYFILAEVDVWRYHETFVHLPAVTHPAPQRAVIVGGGDGGVAHHLLQHPSLEAVTLCELDGDVVRLAREYLGHIHQNVWNNPRLSVELGDGLAYLEQQAQPLDLIYLDMTTPQGFTEPRYSPEFFAHCAELLGVGGLLSLHLGRIEKEPERCRRLLQMIQSQFSVVRPFLVPMSRTGEFWLMVCASQLRDPKFQDVVSVERALQQREIANLQYYNGDMHQAALALPNFIRRLLG